MKAFKKVNDKREDMRVAESFFCAGGQIKEKSFDPVDFWLHEKFESVTGELSPLPINGMLS